MKSRMQSMIAVGALLVSTGALSAQSGAGSDVSGLSGKAVVGGAFTPLPLAGAAAGAAGAGSGGARVPANPNALPAIARVSQAFLNGVPQTSPATGQAIPAAAVGQVGALIAGASPTGVATVSVALQSRGAPTAQTGVLMQALAALASVTPLTAAQAIISAARAFNELVANLPASFLANPPPVFLAIQAALLPMVQAISR